MYKYEMHCHTSPVSACASADVKNTVEFYKNAGYDGIFITNHFLGGNISKMASDNYQDKINFYYSDFEDAAALGEKIGLKVFDGVEMSYAGTDFLVYGINKEWYLKNPQIMDMKMRDRLNFLRENGAVVIHAHPFREAGYINHIRLFPRSIDGVEVINANRIPFENEMARLYAENYGFKVLAGTDNHIGSRQQKFAGIETEEPINSVEDFIQLFKNGEISLFSKE